MAPSTAPAVTGATIAAEYSIPLDQMGDVMGVLYETLDRMPTQREIRRVLDRLTPHVEPGWLAASVAVWAPLLLDAPDAESATLRAAEGE